MRRINQNEYRKKEKRVLLKKLYGIAIYEAVNRLMMLGFDA